MTDQLTGQARLDALGITHENCSVNGYVHLDAPRPVRYPLFRAAENGDIYISFCDLSGNLEHYQSHQKTRPYEVIRLGTPRKDAAGKPIRYISPKGAGSLLFVPPNVVKAYGAGTAIDTLVVVEGEFKAMKGSLEGLSTVGIRGIWNFRERINGKLFEHIPELIKKCKVKNVVLLYDADCLRYEYVPEVDTSQRLFSFYGAAKALRECLQPLRFQASFYFGYVRPDQPSKGLDDLYTERDAALSKEITTDLLSLCEANKYFQIHKELTSAKLKSIFCISNAAEFYKAHGAVIGAEDFLFNGGRFRYDAFDDKILTVKTPHATPFIRVGCDYYKLITMPNAYGVKERALVHWKASEISRDYVLTKIAPDIFAHISKYDTFCNVPANDNTYQQIIDNSYNLYYKLDHQPAPGNWPTIEKYLRHLFDNQYQNKYELMLDYLTLLYHKPSQKLPILCLVSKENETGKSTFFWFLLAIYGENITIIRNDDLLRPFNTHYASKLVTCIDEGFIEKTSVLEKLKSMSTAPKINIEGKGVNAKSIDMISKFMITSNREDDFLYLAPEDERFLVCKVPKIEAAHKNPDILADMCIEIPAFLYDLSCRRLVHPKKSRMWFSAEDVATEQLDKVKGNSGTWTEKNLREVIRRQFDDFEKTELKFTLTELEGLLEKAKVKNFNAFELPRILRDKWNLEPAKNARTYETYSWFDAGYGTEPVLTTQKKTGKYYTFHAEAFLPSADILAWHNKQDAENLFS